ncbi:uncharacterized protein LOC129755312 [Uranotaenia lowii]|uniref:uncharacterized protein LOC129755312 n=1 Tax=Uranotaenia lowii TaxID=190385 RepID=UPI0024793E26|nr:uncharacterized protein LOC129755312 [Uranotaenia lowii]
MGSNFENTVSHSAVYRVNPDCTFLQFVSQQKNVLAGSIASIPTEEVNYQIELALKFMQFYMDQSTDSLPEANDSIQHVVIDTRKSVFEILLDLHSAMRVTGRGFDLYFIGGDSGKDAFVKKLLEFGNLKSGEPKLTVPRSSNPSLAYTTMIVYDSSDLESATDVLSKAWVNSRVPWVIRNVLVQETVQEKFIQLLESKLKPFTENVAFEKELKTAVKKAFATGLRLIHGSTDSKYLKPVVVFGSSIDFFLEKDSVEPTPIVVLNVFRTAKEAISLANKSNGGSVSLWTEELSLSLETAYAVAAQSVWVNCHAVFNPALPYSFRQHDYSYGSEYALCEKIVKSVFVPSSVNPANSFEDNKRALNDLGKPTSQFGNQLRSFVTNEKNVHYEMISSPYKIENYNAENRLQIVPGGLYGKVTEDFVRKVLLDSVYYQRKTIVIPFGVSFAN